MPRPRSFQPAVLAATLSLWAASHIGCMRAAGKAGGMAANSQGLFGRFEAIGGAQPPDPECQNLASETERDRCEKEFLQQTVWPLKGYAVIRNSRGDSTVLALDSLGGYRVALPAGFYTVCVEADGLDSRDACRDSLEVKAGAYTPYSRPFPLP